MKKAHFIGICGTGMSGLAQMLKELGWEVSGSDAGAYPPITTFLEKLGISYSTSYAAENIPSDADVIIIGKHATLVPETNSEVKKAFESGIRVASYPEMLGEITKDMQTVVVAGSFGKSTTTSLLTWILHFSQRTPTFFIGALAPDLKTNAHIGQTKLAVIEGDEYPSANWDAASKFLHYHAKDVLLTSCEHDHVNVFPTEEEYLKPFKTLLKELPDNGTVVACLDGKNVTEVLTASKRSAITYSFSDTRADWYAQNVTRGTKTQFDLMHKGQKIVTLTTQLLGDHNIQNCVGVSAYLLTKELVTPQELAKALPIFNGVTRRLELKTTRSPIPLYEDFGSSKAKLEAGIRTVRQYLPGKRLIVVFEPHTFSFRSSASLEWYDHMFDEADVIYVFAPPTHGAASDQLTLEQIVDRIKHTGKHVIGVHSKTELLKRLVPTLHKDDVIICESSGSLDNAIPALVDFLENKSF